MIYSVCNNHCDSRNIFVPGTRRTVRLPAFQTVEIDFSSDAEMREFALLLIDRAPAAHVVVAKPDSASEPDIPGPGPDADHPMYQESPVANTEAIVTGINTTGKRKRRSRK